MNIKQKSKSLIVYCTFLLLVGLTGISTAGGELSVLSRVRTVDDPELGELIQVALENLPETKRLRQMRPYEEGYRQAEEAEETAKHQTVRLVTEAYTQIKLLDSQIEQSNAKLGSSGQPDALVRELFLAKAELEFQRATKLAELREIMHIIPRHALGRKPVKDLNGWLSLDVIGDSVLVFTGAKPFVNERPIRFIFVKLMSSKEATKYALDYVLSRDHHPVRVDIFRNLDGAKFSEELEKELIRTVKRAELELDAEVHLSEDVHLGSGERLVYGLLGELGLTYRKTTLVVGEKRMKGGVITKVRDTMDAEELGKYVHDKVVGGPERLPVKFLLKYDEQSKDLALRAVKTIQDIAKKHGVEKLVEVAHEQWDPDEER